MRCFAGAGLLGRMGQRMVVFDQDASGLVRMQSESALTIQCLGQKPEQKQRKRQVQTSQQCLTSLGCSSQSPLPHSS